MVGATGTARRLAATPPEAGVTAADVNPKASRLRMTQKESANLTESDLALLRAINKNARSRGQTLHVLRLELLGLVRDSAHGRTLTEQGREALDRDRNTLFKTE